MKWKLVPAEPTEAMEASVKEAVSPSWATPCLFKHMYRAMVAAAPSTADDDELVERVAREIALENGDDFDAIHARKSHWNETRGEAGGRYRDINEPLQSDYLDMARAAIMAMEEGHD